LGSRSSIFWHLAMRSSISAAIVM